ncbi:unnamed protein product [Kuraishia capsulata CBS 1993]|uniref:RRM domain-containing protein n=1 Tax=Kuraishia capsulata CBS 1993 TaxID=1382522 RepID=W6MMX9_9ASCO|nr:uncharacterized protein KUCA_T00003959001 [Kuraishia capsulata CBS 1993]CDK27979.1 unnamed protein product [Kuraishia capsulata CBS 1993]
MSRENSGIDPTSIDIMNSIQTQPQLVSSGSASNVNVFSSTSPNIGRQLSNGNVNSGLNNSMAQLSLNNSLPPQQQQFQSFSIRVKNVPLDISPREAYVLFALSDDLISVELQYSTPIHGNSFSTDSGELSTSPLASPSSIPTIVARFGSLKSAQTAAVKLDSKMVFGHNYHPVKIEFEELMQSIQTNANSIGNSPLLSSAAVAAATNGYITSPPNSGSTMSGGVGNGLPPLSHAGSFSINNGSMPLQQSQSQPQSQQGQLPSSANGFMQKRPSVGSQRSRFLFGDSFNGVDDINAGLNGKSILLMESQNDAREYDQLVRGGPWGSNESPNSVPPPNIQQPQQQQIQGQAPNMDWDRRRQGSAFFSNPPTSQGQPTPTGLGSGSLQQSQVPQSNNQPMQIPSLGQPNVSSSNTITSPQAQPQSHQASIPDLSLLARVPPPVNPADQNPPCNTLYVGNLPPDATEAELRALFAPQQGFRRLSFRTKVLNQNGAASNVSHHSHGPMCFVEFEDVAHATRALAELYGRALPRPGGVSGKGGIRLSFSKNPLGVRGPGQQRRSSTNAGFGYQQSQPQTQFQQQQPLAQPQTQQK